MEINKQSPYKKISISDKNIDNTSLNPAGTTMAKKA
jgi:hypothetical protein